jgi:hypothetical protein
MDSNENWGELEDPEFDKLLNERSLRNLKSKHPLLTLRKNLMLNIVYSIIVSSMIIVAIFTFWIWQVQLALVIVSIFNFWYMFQGYKLYEHIKPNISTENNVLYELETHFNKIGQWIKLSEKIALFIYPISIIGGFLLGGVLGSKKSVDEFLVPKILQILLVTIIILTPTCHYLTKWMNKIMFSNHLKDLAEKIEDLKKS